MPVERPVEGPVEEEKPPTPRLVYVSAMALGKKWGHEEPGGLVGNMWGHGEIGGHVVQGNSPTSESGGGGKWEGEERVSSREGKRRGKRGM